MDMMLHNFTEELAGKAAVPGGGSVAALAGSLGASLASMAANLTSGKKKYAAYQADIDRLLPAAQELRQEFLALMDKDAEAFLPLSKAYGIPKDDPTRDEVMEEALRAASAAPVEVLEKTLVLTSLLDTHDRVFIVAHSMGTLLAIEEAVKRPTKVCGLFLLAVPLVFRVRLRAALGSMQAALGVVKPGSVAEQMVNDSSVRLSPQLHKYLKWLPRFTELTKEALRTHVLLPLVSVPCRAFQSGKDELVGQTSTEILQKQPGIVTAVLPNSGHFSYSAEDLALLQSQLKDMLTTI